MCYCAIVLHVLLSCTKSDCSSGVGASHAVQVRIEQVLLGAHPLLLCFSLTQLLGFYAGTVVRLLGRPSQLAATLGACRAMAARAFADHLKARGDKLMRQPPLPPPDLSPPSQVRIAGLHSPPHCGASFHTSHPLCMHAPVPHTCAFVNGSGDQASSKQCNQPLAQAASCSCLPPIHQHDK